MMLEQLDVRPGHRVMEAGAGTGYNAALLAALAGDNGRVVTLDVDEDLVDGARKHLAAAGVTNVDVILGDGALGCPDGAPYDRIIATVGAYETPTAWLEQLAPDGRLVVPLRLRGAASRSIIFERYDGGWRDQGSELAVFMPLRGIGDDARRLVPITPEQDVILQVHKEQDVDAAALAGVLDTERRKIWTDVFFPPMVPYEWMDLWLACRLDNAIMRMNVQPAAIERGAVTPMFPWGAMATTRGADLAYLTIRPTPTRPDGSRLYEVGVIGHGPARRRTSRTRQRRDPRLGCHLPLPAPSASRSPTLPSRRTPRPDASSFPGRTTPSPSPGSDRGAGQRAASALPAGRATTAHRWAAGRPRRRSVRSGRTRRPRARPSRGLGRLQPGRSARLGLRPAGAGPSVVPRACRRVPAGRSSGRAGGTPRAGALGQSRPAAHSRPRRRRRSSTSSRASSRRCHHGRTR